MNSSPDILVSIGIPTYNRADGFLKEAIQSAVDQTYDHLEIIISDNCSSDNTEALVNSFQDDRIRYFRQEKNIGPFNNFNFCLEQANGDYFLMLHDDDLIDKDIIETCVNAVDGSKDFSAIRTGSRVIDGDGATVQEYRNQVNGGSLEDFLDNWFKGTTVLYFCSTLFHTERLKQIGGFHSRKNLFQDAVAMVKLGAQGELANIADVKASVRSHEGEITHAVRVSDWCDDSLQVVELIQELAETDKEGLQDRALSFFIGLNYRRAHAVQEWFKRLSTYLLVWRKFEYKRRPPWLQALGLR